ncbi:MULTISPECIES: histidine phosphatase family protein [Sporosarcina]|uniref:histidine phosphatase family protein n=1 Tax=Sporosarcina TaxID=1569 RepID=UPI00058DBC05|nr:MULTISPECIES: histidine phosphatase family protein [Sporosarcina]WJY26956.1 histidine phosphatase family protein [Sporosarcina sp. 0.2-SM1T-5]
MGKTIYLVNHGEAEGNGAHDELTAEGIIHSEELGEFLEGCPAADRVITSPLRRARQTAAAIGDKLGIHIEEDSRLAERQMSSQVFDDWLLKVEDTFLDLNLSYEDGESSHDAMQRACDVIAELPDDSRTVIVTHSLLFILILRCYDERAGFEDWQALKHPDVYELQISGDSGIYKPLQHHK